jgi:hypothetical protein
MYKYWSKNKNINGRSLLLISKIQEWLHNSYIDNQAENKSTIMTLDSYNQSHTLTSIPIYYQFVKIKTHKD